MDADVTLQFISGHGGTCLIEYFAIVYLILGCQYQVNVNWTRRKYEKLLEQKESDLTIFGNFQMSKHLKESDYQMQPL